MGALSGQCCVTLNIIHEINSNDSVFVYTIQNNARPEYQKVDCAGCLFRSGWPLKR